MYLLFSISPFADQLTQALCWTFIHSLWQGLVLALVAASLIQLTKKSASVLRYYLLSAIFFLFMVTALVTFFRENKSINLTDASGLATSPAPMQSEDFNSSAIVSHRINQNQLSLVEKCKDYLNAHAMLIVLLWFVFFCIKSLQMFISIGYIQRLPFYKTKAPPLFWINKTKELSERLGITRIVLLLESGIIKVPVVVGFLKPVLLLPFGLLANLPADEIEAILLHELAHIQRKDYFINLVQSFIEVVFFFNPALLWISSLIREERENCCDDVAITVTHNKSKFIQALISFQEYNATVPKYGMAFGNGKGHLLNRVKRIILNKNKTLNTMEKTLFAGSIAAIVLFTFSPVKTVFSLTSTKNSIKESSFFPSTTITSTPLLTVSTINRPPVATGPEKVEITKSQNTTQRIDTIPAPSAIPLPPAKPDASKNEISNDVKQQKQRKKNTEEIENQIKNIDFDKINQEIKEALAKVDFQKISLETEKALKNVDFDQIKIKIELALKEAQIQLKNIDTKKIRKQIEQSQEKIMKENWNMKIDKEKINNQVEEALRNAHQEIEKAKVQNYKMEKEVEEALHIDQLQVQGEPE